MGIKAPTKVFGEARSGMLVPGAGEAGVASLAIDNIELTARAPRRPIYGFAKRAVDLTVSLLMLVALSPLLLSVAILVKLTSPGPVIFRQGRLGQYGKPFICYKFRTMVAEADELKAGLLPQNHVRGPVFKIWNDPRITSVGRWLRKSSVDELPQLVNVIRGEMSLVGPRPPIPDEVERYTSRQLTRLAVTPGLTCLWQVSGRSDIGFEEWVELDIRYIERRGFLYDLWLLARTVPAVVSGRGAT